MPHVEFKINEMELKCDEINMEISKIAKLRAAAIAAVRKPFDAEEERLVAQLKDVQNQIDDEMDLHDELDIPSSSSYIPPAKKMENELQQEDIKKNGPREVAEVTTGNNFASSIPKDQPQASIIKSYITFTISNSDHVNIRV